jgi:hypothetical protein
MRPAGERIFRRSARHVRASAIRVEARALFELQLEQLGKTHPFARACRVPEPALSIGEHDSRGRDVKDLDSAFCQRLEEVDHVVVVDERVREGHERIDELFLTSHALIAPR